VISIDKVHIGMKSIPPDQHPLATARRVQVRPGVAG
jgi:hypothetical protein